VFLKRKHLPPIRLGPSWPPCIDFFFEEGKIILRRVLFVCHRTPVLPTAGTATATITAVRPAASLGSWTARWGIPTFLAVISYLSILAILSITHSVVHISASQLVLISPSQWFRRRYRILTPEETDNPRSYWTAFLQLAPNLPSISPD